MAASMLKSWRSERPFGMPVCAGELAAVRGIAAFVGAGLRSDLGTLDAQVKRGYQPTHINPVGPPSS